jgi:predicted transcriptional regulator
LQTIEEERAIKAADVMATNVISVGPDACVQDVARTLLSARISAVPVVGLDGKLLGMASHHGRVRPVPASTRRPQRRKGRKEERLLPL